MKICTQMTPVGKRRVRVEIDYDHEDTMILSQKDIAAYGLQEGEEIPEDIWNQIQMDLYHAAVQKCGKLLLDMDYSRHGLVQKLVRSGFPGTIAQTAAARMEEAGYVNDRRLADNYLHFHIMDRSLLRIRQDLQQKGISAELIDAAVQAFEEQNTDTINDIEQQQIRSLLQKRNFNLSTADYTEIQKTAASLARKGYSTENIRAAMRNS